MCACPSNFITDAQASTAPCTPVQLWATPGGQTATCRPLPRGLTLLMSRVVLLGRLVLHVLERLRGWEPVHDVTVTEPNPLTS